MQCHWASSEYCNILFPNGADATHLSWTRDMYCVTMTTLIFWLVQIWFSITLWNHMHITGGGTSIYLGGGSPPNLLYTKHTWQQFDLIIDIHRCQLSRNVRDSPRFTSFIPCPARKLLLTYFVPETGFTRQKSGFCIYWHTPFKSNRAK